MHTGTRYILLVLCIVVALHTLLSFTHEGYGRVTSLGNIAEHLPFRGSSSPISIYHGSEPPESHGDIDFVLPDTSTIGVGGYDVDPWQSAAGPRANASFVILARNSDLDQVIRSVREVEERFNRRFNYPYVFLNEVEFTNEFKQRITVITGAKVEFGLIPKEHWFQPDWIDEKKASAARDKMVKENIIYGGSLPYRNMCRFNSGFFFKHPLLQKYRYYWRIEPDVHFHCDLPYDPFVYMEEHKKRYAFTITMYEFEKTIPTLWWSVQKFVKKHPEYLAKGNAMDFQSEDGGHTYNKCHFWSNFEIADMDFWRGEAYQAFFNHLENEGGFYYERWGDAPVHSIAANLFLSKDEIHFFDDIGYEHNPYTHCPRDMKVWKDRRCSCNPSRSFDYDGYSCLRKWDKLVGYEHSG